jgi:RNA polymerase sigma-70 factor (ECF subfamily)
MSEEKTQLQDERSYSGEEGLERMFQEYNPRLAKIVGPLVPDAQVLDDILQEVWIKVYRAYPGFKGKSSLFTWLYRIAVNTAFTMLKRVEYPAEGAVLENVPSGTEPALEYEKNSLRKDLKRALDRLGPRQREIFLLRGFEDMPFKEIGNSLGMTETHARVTYFKTVRLLRSFLKEAMPHRKEQSHE